MEYTTKDRKGRIIEIEVEKPKKKKIDKYILLGILNLIAGFIWLFSIIILVVIIW